MNPAGRENLTLNFKVKIRRLCKVNKVRDLEPGFNTAHVSFTTTFRKQSVPIVAIL